MERYYLNGEYKTFMPNRVSGGAATASTTITNQSSTTATIAPNTLNKWEEVAELTLTLGAETPGIVNEYLVQFTSGATPTVVTVPEDVKWASPLKIKANRIYQISIVNNLATYAEFNALNVPQIILDITADDIDQENYPQIQIVNPDMISQLQPLCDWIAANEHTGEDIDNKMSELEGPLPPEALNMIPGVVCDDGFLIINFPPEASLPELVYVFGIRMSVMQPEMPESIYTLIPNDFMNNPIGAMLDLSTGNLILYMQ